MKENTSPLFLRKMLLSAFLLRFEANYLEKMRGSPSFSLWIPIALAKIYFFSRGTIYHQIHLKITKKFTNRPQTYICEMSREILDCLKRQRDICVKNVIPSQNTAFMFTLALTWR